MRPKVVPRGGHWAPKGDPRSPSKRKRLPEGSYSARTGAFVGARGAQRCPQGAEGVRRRAPRGIQRAQGSPKGPPKGAFGAAFGPPAPLRKSLVFLRNSSSLGCGGAQTGATQGPKGPLEKEKGDGKDNSKPRRDEQTRDKQKVTKKVYADHWRAPFWAPS